MFRFKFRSRSRGRSITKKKAGVSTLITRRSLPRFVRYSIPRSTGRSKRPVFVSKRRLRNPLVRKAFAVRRFVGNVARPFLEYVAEDLHHVPAVELFKKTPAGSVCSRRGERREVLFAGRIAGFRGRSPGRGGFYKRTPESTTVCRR